MRLCRSEQSARARAEVFDRDILEVERLATSALAKVLAQHVVGDREEPGAKARVAAEAIDPAHASSKGALAELLHHFRIADLVREEAMHGPGVRANQLAARISVAVAPG